MTMQWLLSAIEMGAHGFFADKAILTPDMARELLDRNPANRSIVRSRVETYANDMRAGRWAFNGEPIIVSNDGRITNGQHRCAAVIASGVSIETAFFFGVDYETRQTTDQLRPKQAGDYEAMKGTPNAMGCAAIAKMAIAYDTNRSVDKAGITPAETMEYIDANRAEIERAASYAHARATKLRNIASPAIIGFCHFLTRRVHVEASDEYISQIVTGAGLESGDPAMVVRNRLIGMGKATRAIKAEIILHGWNAYRRGLKRTIAKSVGHLPDLI